MVASLQYCMVLYSAGSPHQPPSGSCTAMHSHPLQGAWDGRRARALEAPGALPAASVYSAKPFPRAELAAASPAARTHAEPRNAHEARHVRGAGVGAGALCGLPCAARPARPSRPFPSRAAPAADQPMMMKHMTMMMKLTILLAAAMGAVGAPTGKPGDDATVAEPALHARAQATSRHTIFASRVLPEDGPTKSTYSTGSGKDTPITKLFLVGFGKGPSKSCQDRQGELVSTADLNQRAGGKYIYLCASRRTAAEDASGSTPAVDDVRIQTSSSCPTGWKSPEKFDGLNGDLNQEAGGKDIFMCYKTGDSTSAGRLGTSSRCGS